MSEINMCKKKRKKEKRKKAIVESFPLGGLEQFFLCISAAPLACWVTQFPSVAHADAIPVLFHGAEPTATAVMRF